MLDSKDNQSLCYWYIQGFSLLELLLVVALIGILAAFAVPTYQSYLQKTRFCYNSMDFNGFRLQLHFEIDYNLYDLYIILN